MRRISFLGALFVLGMVVSQSAWSATALPDGAASAVLDRSLDADGDGWADTVEAALGSDPAVATREPESVAVPLSCMNAIDDDGDGAVDEADSGCRMPEVSRTTFPVAGVDAFASTVALDDYDVRTPIGVCPLDFEGEGPVIVGRQDPVDLGQGLREVSTEIVAMQLYGMATFAPGSPCNTSDASVFVAATIVDDPRKPSPGKMTDTNGDPAKDLPATSYFDVMFVMSSTLGTFPGAPPGGTPGTAVRVSNTIRTTPPYHSPGNQKLNPKCYTFGARANALCPKPPLDHLTCYEATYPHFEGTAKLSDQLGKGKVALRTPTIFCNPASTNEQGILDEGDHLTRYVVGPSSGGHPFKSTGVVVQNQFGAHELLVVDRSGLFAPSRMAKAQGPMALDHFTCYAAQGDSLGVDVRLEDQFGIEGARVLKPVMLCVPVQKTVGHAVTPIGDPTTHLVCYAIDAPPIKARTVRVADQFTRAKVRIRKPAELCVPSVTAIVPDVRVDVFPNAFVQARVQTPVGSGALEFTGPIAIRSHLEDLADTDGDGLEQVPIEIVQLDLVGYDDPTGPLVVRLRKTTEHPNLPSVGEVEEKVNRLDGVLELPPFTAAGEATVFFELYVDIEGTFSGHHMILHNHDPLVFTGTITFAPCGAGDTLGAPMNVDVYNEQELTEGVVFGSVVVTPRP